MFKRLALAFVFVLVVPVTLIAAASVSQAATPPAQPFLTDVQVQDMGSFDRVTFVFSGTVSPGILEADYIQGPAMLSPQGEPVQPPIAGAARIAITMFPASGFDSAGGPTYTGPYRFAPDLPSVVELMMTQDFEATMTWVIGVRNLGVTATAQPLADPNRIVVDVPHGGTPVVTLPPSFTG